MERRDSLAVVGKNFNIKGEMESMPEAIDFRELIVTFNSPSVCERMRK